MLATTPWIPISSSDLIYEIDLSSEVAASTGTELTALTAVDGLSRTASYGDDRLGSLVTQTVDYGGSMIVTGSAAVVDGNLTGLYGANVTLDGTGTLTTGQCTVLTDGDFTPNLTTFANVTFTTDSTATFAVPATQTFSFPSGTTTINTGALLDHGTLSVQSNAILNIQGGLTINGQGGLSIAPTSTVTVSGNLLGNTTDSAAFSPQGTVILDSAAGTTNPPQLFEAMSQDLGNVAAGYNNNLAYGTLELTANTYVELVQGSQVLQATSGSGGLFSFSDVGPGSYSLEVVPQTGWVATNSPATITPTSGTNISGLELGEHQIVTISGGVFNDLSDSGVLNSNDPGLSGWTVELLNSSNQIIASDTTDSNGLYSFSNLAPGTYTIEDVLQAGYVQTTPASGSFSVVAPSGGQFSDENFGVYQAQQGPLLYTVTGTADTGVGSLREAIDYVDAYGGAATIAFAIGTGQQTIDVLSPLPAIAAPVTIDGTTQPGYSGTPLIVLDGAGAGTGSNGLTITGNDITVKGLIISGFGGDGIVVTGNDALVESNYIGTDSTGTKAMGNGEAGVAVIGGGTNNTIGGTTDGAGNVIAGNSGDGIDFDDPGTGQDVVECNLIGTDITGGLALPNTSSGPAISAGASDETIGGSTAAASNIVSGNQGDGIDINGGASSSVIERNTIGLNFRWADVAVAASIFVAGILILLPAIQRPRGRMNQAGCACDLSKLLGGTAVVPSTEQYDRAHLRQQEHAPEAASSNELKDGRIPGLNLKAGGGSGSPEEHVVHKPKGRHEQEGLPKEPVSVANARLKGEGNKAAQPKAAVAVAESRPREKRSKQEEERERVPVPVRGKKYALLIAVDRYEKGSLLPGLPFPRRDMEELAKVFLEAGYDKDDVIVMTKERGLEELDLMPTAKHIRNQLKLLLEPLKPGDSVIVGLAGHGVMMLAPPLDDPKGEPRPRSFFCSMDANLARKNLEKFVGFDELYNGLSTSKATVKLLMVDACRNELLAQPEARPGGIALPSPPLPPASVAALFSCSEKEVSWEDKDLDGGHGVFFHYVIEGLKGKADEESRNPDRRVELDELYSYVKNNVPAFVARRHATAQFPRLLGNIGPVALLDVATPSNPRSLTNSIDMRLRLIQAGEFLMGSPDDDKDAAHDEKPQHRVRITRPFYLGVHEVTRDQFRRFVDEAGYRTEAEKDGKGGYGWNEETKNFEQNPRYTWQNPGFEQTDDYPVVNVSWNDAVAFCKWLSDNEKTTYRLPTEAEWEYACRAGTTTRYSFGDDPKGLAAVGNIADGTAEKYPGSGPIAARGGYVYYTAPVGRFQPNAFGLCDMHGNVWEWCSDWYDADYYRQSRVDDPAGAEGAAVRVIRGGSRGPQYARSAYRHGTGPGDRHCFLGFRVARVQSAR